VSVTTLFDYCFAENGLTAYRLGKPLASNSFIQWIGEEKYQKLVNFILKYIANLDIPKKRGTFLEFRNGMINVSPIGRNASTDERNEFQEYAHYDVGAFVPFLTSILGTIECTTSDSHLWKLSGKSFPITVLGKLL